MSVNHLVVLSRRLLMRGAVIGLVWSISTVTSAALLFYDGFNYTVGQNLSNQTHPNGSQWLRPSAPTGATQVVNDQDVPYANLITAPETNSVMVTRPGASANGYNRINVPAPSGAHSRANDASLFYSFTMKIVNFTNFAAVGTDTKNDAAAKNDTHRKGGLVAGFHGGPASTSTAMSTGTTFAGGVYARRELDMTQMGTDGTLGTQTGRYEFGISKQVFPGAVTGAQAESYFNTSFSFGQNDTLFIVGQYQFVDDAPGGTGDIARLWINPTPGDISAAATPTVSVPLGVANTLATELASFHLRGDTNSPGSYLIDNVRIGTTFADVIRPVPEPGSLVLLLLGAVCFAARRTRT